MNEEIQRLFAMFFTENKFSDFGEYCKEENLTAFLQTKQVPKELHTDFGNAVLEWVSGEPVNISVPVYAPLKLSEVCGRFSSKRVKFEALLVGMDNDGVVVKTGVYGCQICGAEVKSEFTRQTQPPQVCPECKRRALNMEVEKSTFVNVAQLYVQELPANATHSLAVRKPFKVLLSQDTPRDFAGVIKLNGTLALDCQPKGKTGALQKLMLIADGVEASRDFYKEYRPTPEDEANFAFYFNVDSYESLKKQSDGTIAPFICGRPLEKLGNDLALHSGLCNGKENIQACVLNAGDSRTGKSDILQDLIFNLTPSGCDYVACESASRTGISYSIDTSGSEPRLEFGALVACDGGAVALDAINALPQEEQAQLREVITRKKVSVKRMIKGEALARTRIIGATNLPKDRDVGSYVTRCQAAMNSLFSRIDRNRYDFVFVYGEHDVPLEKIDASEKEKKSCAGEPARLIPAAVYQKHLAYCWKQRDIKWEDGVQDELIAGIRRIHKEKLDGLELVSNEFTKVGLNWVVAVAQRCHSFVDGACLVKKKHIEFYLQFVEEWLSNLEVEKELALRATTNMVDAPSIAENLNRTPNKRAFVLLVARGAIQQKNIAERLGQKANYISELKRELFDIGLVETAKDSKGIQLSDLGVKVARLLADLSSPTMS